MPPDNSMIAYYQARAREYEAIYDTPERQADLARLKSWLAAQTRGRAVLEAACGTGYWTAVAATSAQTIHATDINDGPLKLAQSKTLGPHVTFAKADAFDLSAGNRSFDCGMAHFWWSHVAIADQQRFLAHIASRLCKGATLLMIDNMYVAGSSTPIWRRDGAGNTYQHRTLKDGSQHEVLKNFPDSTQLRASLATLCNNIDILILPHYWAVSARFDGS
jgi:2-polyprenyl-3-methyl-5-hydroxy-6-metoxy-1,4-benzoquinol methylase